MRLIRTALFSLPVLALVLTGARWQSGGLEGSMDLASRDAFSMMEMMPAVTAAFEQIERAQKVNELMTQGPTPPRAATPTPSSQTERLKTSGGICTDCNGPRVADVRYGQCNSRNDYFEDRLAGMRQRGGLLGDLLTGGPKADSILKPTCLRAGLDSRYGANSQVFAACAPGENQARQSQVRPCVSENYFTLLNNSFDLVARCMGPMISGNPADQREDIRLMFGMLNIESGLHMNVVSSTGAAGIGQFTSDAIDDVNDNDFPQLRSKLEAMGGSCARMSRDILSGNPPMRATSSRSCDRVALERGNPLLNLVYMFAYVARAKKDFSRDFFDDRRFAKFFAGLPPHEKNRLRTILTMWSHNTGPAGLRTPLMALLNTKYRGSQVTDVNQFVKDLAQSMRQYPHPANDSESRRSETSNYWPVAASALSKLERDAGGGSCVQ